MRFAIRDDDTNYFTKPEEIIEVYEDIWNICPPTLSIISHVKGNWRHWMNQIYAIGKNIDWEEWWRDDVIHPIGQNKELIEFLNVGLDQKRIGISMHGIHHRADFWFDPTSIKNNFILGAEFNTKQDKTEQLAFALKYLEELFNRKIQAFTPPQNILSLEGYKAIANNGLNINGSGINIFSKITSIKYLPNAINYLLYRFRYPNIPYPFVQKYKTQELVSYFPLYPTTDLNNFFRALDYFESRNGSFVLSTHYHEMDKVMYQNGLTLKQGLLKIIDYAQKRKRIQFCTLSEIFT